MHLSHCNFPRVQSGDMKLLVSDLQALRPTLFPTVPRLLNRIHNTVYANLKESKVKEVLFKWALNRKLADVRRGVFRRDTIWDRIGKSISSSPILFHFVVCLKISPRIVIFVPVTIASGLHIAR